MNWKETETGLWTLDLAETIHLAVFRPAYDPEHWHYSINGKDSADGFSSPQAAQTVALRVAIVQIELSFTKLAQAKKEAETILQQRQKEEAGSER